jgi:hypothetical protein
MNTENMKRILLAESPDVMPLAFKSLGVRNAEVPIIGTSVTGANFLLVPCMSLASAKASVYDKIDLIVCGMHFDDSRMFDLLRFVKADPEIRTIPFLCVKAVEGSLDATFYQSVKIATQALGADGFFDLSELRKKLGEEQALEEIGKYISHLVSHANRF